MVRNHYAERNVLSQFIRATGPALMRTQYQLLPVSPAVDVGKRQHGHIYRVPGWYEHAELYGVLQAYVVP